MGFAARLAAAAAALGLAACGGSGGSGAASCTPTTTAATTITATGISPTNVCVSPLGTVTFTNSDTVSHHIEFEPSNCPTMPEIPAGRQGTATFPTEGTCSFHDGNNASAAAFQGAVAVTSIVVSGGGY